MARPHPTAYSALLHAAVNRPLTIRPPIRIHQLKPITPNKLQHRPTHPMKPMTRISRPIITRNNPTRPNLHRQQLELRRRLLIAVHRIHIRPIQAIIRKSRQHIQITTDMQHRLTAHQLRTNPPHRLHQRRHSRLTTIPLIPPLTQQIPRIDQMQPRRLQHIQQHTRQKPLINPQLSTHTTNRQHLPHKPKPSLRPTSPRRIRIINHQHSLTGRPNTAETPRRIPPDQAICRD